MISIITLATKQPFLEEVFKVPIGYDYEIRYQGKQNDYFPILFEQDGKLIFQRALWGISNRRSAFDYSEIPIKDAFKRKPHNIYVRGQRCIIPANAFLVWTMKATYLIRLVHDRLFGIGGYYVFNKKNNLYSFSIYTTDLPQILEQFIEGNQIPVLMEVERVKTWLQTSKVSGVMDIANSSSKKYFDIFEITNRVFVNDVNDPGLLRPIGKSLQEQQCYKATVDYKIDKLRSEHRK